MTAAAKIDPKQPKKKSDYRSRTPEDMTPVVRKPDFDFTAEDIPRYWWDNNPVKTMMLAAMSSGFPPGERFFIDSVRHYEKQITDPALKKAIKGFIGQEAHHSKEHKALNGFLVERGIRLDRLEAEIQGFMDWMRANFTPERQLAHTVAVEHFTAMMAEEFVLKFDTLDEMDPRMAAVWAWHAIEESEHKAVAFDVYKSIGGSEFVRLTEMMMVSFLFPVFTSMHMFRLLKDDGQLGNVRAWADYLNFMYGKPGIVRKMLPAYFKFYSPRFHPWNHDARGLVQQAKEKWLDRLLPGKKVG